MPNSSADKHNPGIVEYAWLRIRSRLGLLVLICFHTIICCISLVNVAGYQSYMLYDGDQLYGAVFAAAAFSAISLLFVLARFSFGYVVGFYFYTMVLGFIWLSNFTKYHYDHKLAALSAAIWRRPNCC